MPGGYRAIDSLRFEKGYRVWGTDITSETDPYSSGLGFAVAQRTRFLGRDALRPRRRPHRLVCLVLDDLRSVALGNEPVRTDDGQSSAGDQRRAGFRARRVDRLRVAARQCWRRWHAPHRRGVRRVRRRRGRAEPRFDPGRPGPRLTHAARLAQWRPWPTSATSSTTSPTPARRPQYPEVEVELGMVVEDRASGFCGDVVRWTIEAVTLRDRHQHQRHFAWKDGGFLLDGRP